MSMSKFKIETYINDNPTLNFSTSSTVNYPTYFEVTGYDNHRIGSPSVYIKIFRSRDKFGKVYVNNNEPTFIRQSYLFEPIDTIVVLLDNYEKLYNCFKESFSNLKEHEVGSKLIEHSIFLDRKDYNTSNHYFSVFGTDMEDVQFKYYRLVKNDKYNTFLLSYEAMNAFNRHRREMEQYKTDCLRK